jgi:hypothetical protein
MTIQAVESMDHVQLTAGQSQFALHQQIQRQPERDLQAQDKGE